MRWTHARTRTHGGKAEREMSKCNRCGIKREYTWAGYDEKAHRGYQLCDECFEQDSHFSYPKRHINIGTIITVIGIIGMIIGYIELFTRGR